MTNIRASYDKPLTSEIRAVRGDSLSIPLTVVIPEGVTIRVQLRKGPESLDYYVLEVIDNHIIIPTEISSALVGLYQFDVEFTYQNNTVKTVQRAVINFEWDITRIYGDELPFETSDIERRKIVATEFNVRFPNNQLEKLLSSPSVNKIIVTTVEEFNALPEKEPKTLYLF